MSRAVRKDTEGPGQDSFLDIVANLVGILIILVMVIGMRTKEAVVEAAVAKEVPVELEPIELEPVQMAVRGVQGDIHDIQEKIGQVTIESIARHQQRDQLQTLVVQFENEFSQRQRQLDAESRERLAMREQLASAAAELEDLARAKRAVVNQIAPPNLVEHLPTPLAKTVFGKEYHFRLVDERLAYVPMNELSDQLRGHFKEKMWKLKQSPQVTESLGPVRDFRMEYTMARARGNLVQLVEFKLIPVNDNVGEFFARAMEPGSEFMATLAKLDPQRTTITVWTYPDSYDNFRALKKVLYDRGFLTAGRPMPAGYPISGSPSGNRSSAQ